jgi:hypothetical protein
VTPILRAQITGGLIGGEVYYAELPGQEIVGVAVWFGPGQKILSSYVLSNQRSLTTLCPLYPSCSDEQLNAGWKQVMLKLEAKYSAWWDYVRISFSRWSPMA